MNKIISIFLGLIISAIVLSGADKIYAQSACDPDPCSPVTGGWTKYICGDNDTEGLESCPDGMCCELPEFHTATCVSWTDTDGYPMCTLGGAPGLNVGGCLNYDQTSGLCTTRTLNIVHPGCCPDGSGGDPPGGGGAVCERQAASPTYCTTYGWDGTTAGLMAQVYEYKDAAHQSECFPGLTAPGYCMIANQPGIADRLMDGTEGIAGPKSLFYTCWNTNTLVRWGGEFNAVPNNTQKPGLMYLTASATPWQFRILANDKISGFYVLVNGVNVVNNGFPESVCSIGSPAVDIPCYTGGIVINTTGWYTFEVGVYGYDWGASAFEAHAKAPTASGFTLIRADRYQFRPNCCSTPGGPTNLIPNNTPICANSASFSWTAPGGTAPHHYLMHINDTSNGWNGCSAPFAGDSCIDNIAGTSQVANLACGHAYNVRVFSVNSCGDLSATAASANFTSAQTQCAPAPPTFAVANCTVNQIKVDWTDNSTNETQFELTRTVSAFPAPATKTVVSTTTPGTGTAYSYPDDPPSLVFYTPYQYTIRSRSTTNPAACQYSTPVVTANTSCVDFSQAWFQTKGCGVTAAGGVLSVKVPPEATIPLLQLSGDPEILPVPTGVPGVVYASGVGGNLGPSNVSILQQLIDLSPAGWNTGTNNIVNNPENRFDSIKERIVSRATPIVVAGTLDQTSINNALSSATTANKLAGVTILEANGNVVLDQGSVDAEINLGGNQALLIVTAGSLSINSRIKHTSGSGFFSAIVENDINISSGVGEAPPAASPYQVDLEDNATPPHLMGVYYAQGTVSTGSLGSPNIDKQIEVQGSIVGMTGINLQRLSFGQYPSEYIACDPNSIKILRDVGLRRIIKQELVW